ncbi:TonB-dependent receptor [Methylophilus sp. OH31]|uniref:TonB-dependent siderophore receptor n=1 Tax=Methylophilus sp. OH31 TaxID=1387312 RepID=UPI0004641D08|nr:TonB-dependent receptor [Methylophilus sp. OH31]
MQLLKQQCQGQTPGFRLAPVVLALQLVCLPLLASSPLIAYAEPAVASKAYDIPAGPLASTLTRFAQQSGVAISLDAADIQHLRSAGLKGAYTVEEGFAKLLAETGYSADKTAAGYSLRKSPAPRDDASQSTLPEVKVTAEKDREMHSVSEGTKSYAARAVTIGKGIQSLRELPQSVSVVTRQRMDDQNLTTLDSVLMQTTGVTKQLRGYGHSTYYSRGFEISNYMVDGVPMGDYGGIGTPPDTIMLDRVEVMRGAPGLLIGNGDPGGTVNMVRKRPMAEQQLQLTGRAGSWDYYRMDADLTGALNAAGTLRGRIIAGYEDRQYFYDEAASKLPLLYGIIEADLGEKTVAAIGMRYQDFRQYGGRWRGGLPMSTDGSNLHLPRSTSLGPDWTGYQSQTQEVFADLTHAFNDDWKFKVSAMYQRNDRKDAIIRPTATNVNPATMTGPSYMRAEFSRVLYETSALDAQVIGQFNALGQTHEVFVGANWQLAEMPSSRTARTAYSPQYPIDFNNLDLSQVPQVYPGVYGAALSSKEIRQGLYGNVRLQLADPLKLILGGRVSWYDYESSFNGAYKQAHEVTSYAALIYRLNDNWSLYGSYTDIFKPQSNSFTASGGSLDPAVGKNYEAGLKGEFYGGKLNTSLTVFSIKQTNGAIIDPLNSLTCSGSPTGGSCYINAGKQESKGFDGEVSGEVLPGWQVYAGYTFNDAKYVTAEDASLNGVRLNGDHNPRHLLRAWNTYRLSGELDRFTIGGGVVMQSGTAYTTADSVKREQSGYAIWSAQASYKIDNHWTAALNINNVFDKHYYLDALQTFYGDPQNFMLTIRGTL